jgi:uncharacterized protein YeaO (DUF488 family)
MLRTKRVYERPDSDDGYRVLVDRSWPRGLTKEKANVDEWLREAGPSDDLRRWFHNNPEKWEEFKASYIGELRTKGTLLNKIATRSDKARVTLLYSYNDPVHNQAVVLKEFLDEMKTRLVLAA